MAIQFVCSKCHNVLETQDESAGGRIVCPYCSIEVAVPTGAPEVPVEFACFSCGTMFKVPARLAGKRTHCPKCKAVIQVPGVPPVETVPAPANEPEAVPEAEAPPTPVPAPGVVPPVKPSATPGSASAVPDEEKHVTYKPAPAMSTPTIVVLVASGVLALVCIIAFIKHATRPKAPATLVPLSCTALYNQIKDELILANNSASPLSNLQVTIFVGPIPYKRSLPGLAPWDKANLPLSSFSGPADHPLLDSFATPPTMIEVQGSLANGARGICSTGWGARPPAPNPTPSTEPATK